MSKQMLKLGGGPSPLGALRRWVTGLLVWSGFLASVQLARVTGVVDVDAMSATLVFLALGTTLLLAGGLSRRLRSVEDAVVELVIPGAEEISVPFDEAEERIYQEVRRARRYARPLALVSVRVDPSAARAENHELASDLQDALMWRHANAQLARMLDIETSGCQILAEREDHFVALLPETDRSGAAALSARLRGLARDRFGLELDIGISSFPDESVTFSRLIETSEAEMLENREKRDSTKLPGYAPEASAGG